MLWMIYAALYIRIIFFDRIHLAPWIPSTFHLSCVTWNSHNQLHPVFSSLVCGDELPLALKSLFLQLGVFHWFVASGGHLVFLQTLLHRLHVRHFLITSILLISFSLTCGLQPPILRALVNILLLQLSKRWALFLKPHQTTLLSGLWSLFLFPEWYESFSFQLSWLVSLALPWSPKHTMQSFWVSLLLIPLSLQWSVLHLIYNVILTPLFSVVLFPLTLLCFAIAPWTLIGNTLWEWVVVICELLPKDQNPLTLPQPLLCWVYILGIHCSHILYQKSRNV